MIFTNPAILSMSSVPVAAAPTAAQSKLPLTPAADVGSVIGGGGKGKGGGGGGFDIGGIFNSLGGKLKNALLYGAIGGAAGMVFPFIPGGPVGGAIIGAAISLLM